MKIANPPQTATSARLKTGQRRKSKKSVTCPSPNRSQKFAPAPPTIKPKPILPHKLFREILLPRIIKQRIANKFANIDKDCLRETRPKKNPEFSTRVK